MLRVYIAGPMSGLTDYNFPAFFQMEHDLRGLGYQPINPARLGVMEGWTWEEYIVRDVPLLLQCDALITLQGWRASKGASLEVELANTVGIPVVHHLLDLWTTCNPLREDNERLPDEPITQEANRLVTTERGAAYGHPLDDFSKIAQIWSALLGCTVTPEQVGLCMIGVKLSREVNAHKRDTLVDIAGYAQTVQMVHDERTRRFSASTNGGTDCTEPQEEYGDGQHGAA